MSVWPSGGTLYSLGFRALLWIAIGIVLVLSFLFYSPESTQLASRSAPLGWLFRSWPALFAAAGAMALLLNGPVSSAVSWVQKGCRVLLVSSFILGSSTFFVGRPFGP